MGISKFTVDGVTQIDLTNDTVTPENLYLNATAVNAAGDTIEGAAQIDNEDKIVQRSISGVYSNSNIVSVRETAFNGFTGITEINLPNATTLNYQAFYGCSNLVNVNVPNVTTIGGGCFQNCSKIQNFYIPKVQSIGSSTFNSCTELTTINLPELTTAGNEAFGGCKKLINIYLPKLKTGYWRMFATGITTNTPSSLKIFLPSLTYLNTQVFHSCIASVIVLPSLITISGGTSSYTFQVCSTPVVDFGSPTNIPPNCFSSAKVNTLILRKKDSITTLSNISAFNGTPFASGGTGGILYVPQALLSLYESATNWSTIIGYENNQILQIEGTEYEFNYADGTPIST